MSIRSYNNSINNQLEEIHGHCIYVEEREIYLHGHIDESEKEDPGTDFRMANVFVKNFLFLDKKPATINIFHNNIGGEWGAGMMIYDIIKNAQSHVNMICQGEIMSMGTIITQAADVRYTMPHCIFMFHHGFTDIQGQRHLAAQSWASHEKDMEKVMLDIYTAKCQNGVNFSGKKPSQVKSALKTKFSTRGDWFLTAEEAKAYGFIDKIIGVDCELKDL